MVKHEKRVAAIDQLQVIQAVKTTKEHSEEEGKKRKNIKRMQENEDLHSQEWHQHSRGTCCLHLQSRREEWSGVEEIGSLKLLVHLYQTTWRYISEVWAVSASYHPLHEGTVENQSWLKNFHIGKVTQNEVRICLSGYYYTDRLEGSVGYVFSNSGHRCTVCDSDMFTVGGTFVSFQL